MKKTMKQCLLWTAALLLMLSCDRKPVTYYHFSQGIPVDRDSLTTIPIVEKSYLKQMVVKYAQIDSPSYSIIPVNYGGTDSIVVIYSMVDSFFVEVSAESGTSFGFGAGSFKQDSDKKESYIHEIGPDNRYFDTEALLRIREDDEGRGLEYSWIRGDESVPEPVEVAKYFEEGDNFPDFQTMTIDSAAFSSVSLAGKPVVINWWHTGCGPCREEFPDLNNFVDKYGENVRFLAITVDEDVELLKEFLKEFDFKYEHLLANDELKSLLHSAYPVNVIIDKNGKVVFAKSGLHYTSSGEHDFTAFEEVLQKVVNE